MDLARWQLIKSYWTSNVFYAKRILILSYQMSIIRFVMKYIFMQYTYLEFIC